MVVCGLDVRFNTTTLSTINCVIYTNFQTILEIDTSGQVMMDFCGEFLKKKQIGPSVLLGHFVSMDVIIDMQCLKDAKNIDVPKKIVIISSHGDYSAH